MPIKMREFSEPYNTSIELGQEHREARARRYAAAYGPAIERMAQDQARADRSDPFAYARVKAHLSQGIGDLSDYDADFVPKTFHTAQGEVYILPVPVNMKRM